MSASTLYFVDTSPDTPVRLEAAAAWLQIPCRCQLCHEAFGPGQPAATAVVVSSAAARLVGLPSDGGEDVLTVSYCTEHAGDAGLTPRPGPVALVNALNAHERIWIRRFEVSIWSQPIAGAGEFH